MHKLENSERKYAWIVRHCSDTKIDRNQIECIQFGIRYYIFSSKNFDLWTWLMVKCAMTSPPTQSKRVHTRKCWILNQYLLECIKSNWLEGTWQYIRIKCRHVINPMDFNNAPFKISLEVADENWKNSKKKIDIVNGKSWEEIGCLKIYIFDYFRSEMSFVTFIKKKKKKKNDGRLVNRCRNCYQKMEKEENKKIW